MPRQTIFLSALLLVACSGAPEPQKTVQVPVVSVKPEPAKGIAEAPQKSRTKRKPEESPNGDVVSILLPDNTVEVKSKTGASRSIDANSLHPPPGNRALFGIAAMSAAFLDDGTLLIGIADGTLIALGNDDKRKWSIGFRGAVTGITPTEDNRFVVTTQRGVVASLTADGQILWEKQVAPGALTKAVIGPNDHYYVAGPRGVLAFSPDGELDFSHAATLGDYDCCTKEALKVDGNGRISLKKFEIRASDPHPPIANAEPVFLLNFERVLEEKVSAVLATGPDELLLLVNNKKDSALIRYSKGTAKRIKLPVRAAKADRIDQELKPEIPILVYDDLVLGPNGNPWLLARATFAPVAGMSPWWAQPAKGMILELVGDTVRERSDLKGAFDNYLVTTNSDTQIRAATEGTSRILCFGNEDNSAACAIYDGNQAEVVQRNVKTSSVGRIGDHLYVVSDRGKVERLEGTQLVPIPLPETIYYGASAIGGTGDNDLWFASGDNVVNHYDGKSFSAMGLPRSIERGVIARSPTDVWSRDGQVHWDGKRWAAVGGVPVASGMVLRGQNEVWIGNSSGLFRSTAPGPSVVRLPAAKSLSARLVDAPKPLTLDAPLSGFTVTKTKLDVKAGEPITTAKRVEVARDGTLWIEAWDRLVEMDTEGKTTVVDKEEKRIEFDRWFFPEARGRGITTHRNRKTETNNERDELRRFDNGKFVNAEMKLPGKDIVAISGNQTGAVWILGSVEASSPYTLTLSHVHEFGIHALVRADEKSKFQPVLGLPPLAYVSVAVTPESGGFFVGAVNPGPMGEGFLLHARGSLGTSAVARHRAPAALLAVTAISNDEAWAVGAMGIVLHLKGDVVERFALPTGEWLRSVAATGPNDIWIGGDGGTLLHYDGQKFRPVPHPLGSHAAFSGLGISRGTVWATSPSGILRIAKN